MEQITSLSPDVYLDYRQALEFCSLMLPAPPQYFLQILSNCYQSVYRFSRYASVCVCRNMMVAGLQEIDKQRSSVQDVQIPLDVFE